MATTTTTDEAAQIRARLAEIKTELAALRAEARGQLDEDLERGMADAWHSLEAEREDLEHELGELDSAAATLREAREALAIQRQAVADDKARGHLWVSNNGSVACAEHGGQYLASAITARPDLDEHVTPLDVWYRTMSDDPDLMVDTDTGPHRIGCEGCESAS